MKSQMLVEVVVRNRNGKVVEMLKRECRSYVMGMIDTVNVHISQTSRSIKDTGGVDRTIQMAASNLAVNEAAGGANYGVRVGTGSNAVAISDYCLQTPIAHGSGAGQLTYGAVSVGGPLTVGSTRKFTVARTFTNNSGGDITVNEVGLICRSWDGGSDRYFLLERTLLTFLVGNGLSATVTYTIKVTV